MYSNPFGEDDDDFEMTAFFNRNLRLAHLYGCYATTMDEPGGDAVHEFDLCANEPPVVDLGGVQQLAATPLAFYDPDQSSTCSPIAEHLQAHLQAAEIKTPAATSGAGGLSGGLPGDVDSA